MRNEDFTIHPWPLDPFPAGVNAWPVTVIHLRTRGYSRRTGVGQHVHPHLVIKGRGTFQSKAGKFNLSAGEMFCLLPGVAYDLYEDARDPWELYAMRMEGSGNTMVARAMGFSSDIPVRSHIELEKAIQTYRAMFDYWGSKNHSPHEGIALFHRFIASIQPSRPIPAMENTSRATFQEATALIDSLMDTGLNVEDLSRRLGVNRTTLWRVFREEARTTVVEWIQRRRIEKAKTILSQTDIKVREVAGICGFQEEKSFLRSFRQRAGETPSQWRKKSCEKNQ